MATSDSVDSGGYQGRVLRFEWGTNSTNPSNNVRNIWYKVTAIGGSSSYYYHHNETIDINGSRVYTGSDSHQVYTNDVLASGNMDINQNDTMTLSVEMHGGIYSRDDNISTTKSWSLDEIPRYLSITGFYVQSKSINTAEISWSVSDERDATQYSLNGGDWQYDELNNNASDNKSGSFIISNLNPNTTYMLKIRCKRSDSQLWTESGMISFTTYDIGKISSANNFNHGDNTIIGITNPSGSSLNLLMKIGETQILNRDVSTGNNTIGFNDIELDNIYKLYGGSNSVTATFILTTAGIYTNSKDVNITLTGNQKTAYTTGKKRVKVYVGVNGNVKNAVVWIGNNGRKRCI